MLFHGVIVNTLDSESSDLSLNLSGIWTMQMKIQIFFGINEVL